MNSTVYIALIIIAAFIGFMAFISWFVRFKKRELRKRLYREFDELVAQNSLQIDKRQTLSKNIIGIDRHNMKLAFIDNAQTPSQTQVIDLGDISSCKLVKNKNRKTGHITNIALQFHFRQKNKPEIIFPVYNEFSDDLYKLMRLSKKATYWEKTINLFRETKPAA